jgi:hypothetical protein
MANAAWLALTGMAHNLGRAVGATRRTRPAASYHATLRRALFTIPGRLVHSARRLRLRRLPEQWPWAEAFTAALTSIAALPMLC